MSNQASAPPPADPIDQRHELAARFARVRRLTELLCAPLAPDDHQIQSIAETSPPKWHLAHVTWFFETFLLEPFEAGYQPHDPRYGYLFNSYYYGVGEMQPRPRRGLLARPTLDQVHAYRAAVDRRMAALLGDAPDRDWPEIARRTELGINHEQQHQELLLMDIKHNFSVNPLRPAYHRLPTHARSQRPMRWIDHPGGEIEIGTAAAGFAFDNERPRHGVRIAPHRLADRLVTNAEYREFIDDGGYRQPLLWLADGWALLQEHRWQAPLYWERIDGDWHEFTLGGELPLDPAQPVCHLSYYEADAFARWSGARLPDEAELEVALTARPLRGHFMDQGRYHPLPADEAGQWYGDLWNWTRSPYTPYPGFCPLGGGMGEYNGKFMCNQMVLRGGACVTPREHMRAGYRNFFYPHDRWPFTGLRLAADPE